MVAASLRYFLAPICPVCSQCISLSTEFLGMSLWMIKHMFWPLLRLAEEILLLGLPSPTFSFIAHSWGSKSYIFTTVYLSLDHLTFSAKAQGPIYTPGSLIPTIAPKNFGFSPLIRGEKMGFWLWRIKSICFYDFHTWEYRFACHVTVRDALRPAMSH